VRHISSLNGGPLVTWLAALCLLLPWLNPAAGGPSAVMQPWLLAAALTLLLWAIVDPPLPRFGLALAIGAGALLVGVGRAAPPVLLAVASLAVVAACAAVGAASGSCPWIARAIANGWLAAALVSSVLALLQYFGAASALAPWVDPTEAGEAFANLRQRNQFATLTSIGLVSLLWRVQDGSRLAWTLPAAVLLACANAASASRTGALQILVVLALTLWWLRARPARTTGVAMAATLGYALAAVLLPIALQQFAGVTAPNAFGRLVAADGCGSRAVLWSNVLHLIAQKPWWGWGWGELDYAHFATLYPGPRFCDILDNAHNLPLHLAVELGVPVAVAACSGFVVWLLRQRPWGESNATRQLGWGVVAVIVLHSLLEYPLWYGPFQMALGLSLGLLAARSGSTATGLVWRFGRASIHAALVLALAYTAWDYHRISQLYLAPEQRSAWYRHRSLPEIGDSWLFRDQVAFAELSGAGLTRDNAAAVHARALDLLHYSPEPRVIDVAIESALWLGREDEAVWLLARLRAAFPDEHAKLVAAPPLPAASQPAVSR
jgi:O-antigen ligase